MQTIPPTLDLERLAVTARKLAGMRSHLALIGEVAQRSMESFHQLGCALDTGSSIIHGDAVPDLEENDRLIEATCAEFSPDAMRWSPPADGEETPPCPA